MDQNAKSIHKRNKSQVQHNIQISPRDGSVDIDLAHENSALSSLSNTLQQVKEVIQEQAGEENHTTTNQIIDSIDPKMLDTLVSAIHTKKVPMSI